MDAPRGGLEPPTFGLKVQRSTDWANKALGCSCLLISPCLLILSCPLISPAMIIIIIIIIIIISYMVPRDRLGTLRSYITYGSKLQAFALEKSRFIYSTSLCTRLKFCITRRRNLCRWSRQLVITIACFQWNGSWCELFRFVINDKYIDWIRSASLIGSGGAVLQPCIQLCKAVAPMFSAGITTFSLLCWCSLVIRSSGHFSAPNDWSIWRRRSDSYLYPAASTWTLLRVLPVNTLHFKK